MTDRLAVAAPGSVLLLGEYAITEAGAPGIALALLPEVRATCDPRGAPRITGRMGPLGFRWTPDRCDSTLLTALVRECGPPRGSIEVDSSAFVGPHGKLGLGSSAAVAVVVAALLLHLHRPAAGAGGAAGGAGGAPRAGATEAAGGAVGAAGDAAPGGATGSRPDSAAVNAVSHRDAVHPEVTVLSTRRAGVRTDSAVGFEASVGKAGGRGGIDAGGGGDSDPVADERRRVLAAALAAHRVAQGGSGSGYDVATSVWGGVVSVTGGRLPSVSRQRPPSLPQLRLVQGPRPLATPAAVARYEQWCRGAPAAAAGFRERSQAVVEQFLDAEDAVDCCAAIRAGGELFRWLGERIGVAVEPPELRARLDVMRRCGWAAKPVGAGGELGIAAAPAGTEPPPEPYVAPLRLAPEGLRWLT